MRSCEILPQHNLEHVVFTPVAHAATRVSALLTGEIDMIFPVPAQDIERIDTDPGTTALIGPGLRTIFLGMDQQSNALGSAGAENRNPFKDICVRRAFTMLSISTRTSRSSCAISRTRQQSSSHRESMARTPIGFNGPPMIRRPPRRCSPRRLFRRFSSSDGLS